MRLSDTGGSPADEAEVAVTIEDVQQRVRRFAVLRAAQRALDGSMLAPQETSELGARRDIRERLVALSRDAAAGSALSNGARLRDEMESLDGVLDDYRSMLLGLLDELPLSQLRATLSNETHQSRIEVSALLEICLEAETVPGRFLRVVDFLITLLSVRSQGGRWLAKFDPADLNDFVRRRCAQAGEIDTKLESSITGRFQEAAQRVRSPEEGTAVIREMAAYKSTVAGFYFVPSVLRCIVGYNVAARNHVEERARRGREADSEVESSLGVFAPLLDADPQVAVDAGPGIPAQESPAVLAVETAIRRRLQGGEEPTTIGPAERIAAALDLSRLEDAERKALLEPAADGGQHMVRMAVLLGHLASCSERMARDLERLGLELPQLDRWICALADDVQRAIDGMIRDSEYEGAVRLEATKGGFLAAVQVLARRRLGRRRRSWGGDCDTLHHDAVDLLREYLERERLFGHQRVFMDLFGGGWRRTAALSAAVLLVAGLGVTRLLPDDHPRRIAEVDRWETRDISTLLQSAYRDRAERDSLFVGTLRNDRWNEMGSDERKRHADVIRDRVLERGVDELLLFDEDNVLQAHYVDGAWRTARAWESR